MSKVFQNLMRKLYLATKMSVVTNQSDHEDYNASQTISTGKPLLFW